MVKSKLKYYCFLNINYFDSEAVYKKSVRQFICAVWDSVNGETFKITVVCQPVNEESSRQLHISFSCFWCMIVDSCKIQKLTEPIF